MPGFKPIVTLGLAVICVVIYVFPTLSDTLIYNRLDVAGGNVGSLLSGHFVHYSYSHLFLNLMMLLPFGVLLEQQGRLEYVVLILLTLLLLALCQWFYLVDMQRYAGLSGLVTAIATSLSLRKIHTEKASRTLWLLMLCAILFKILYEFIGGTSIFQLDVGESFRLVPEIHLTGVLAACGYAMFTFGFRFWRKNNLTNKASVL